MSSVAGAMVAANQAQMQTTLATTFLKQNAAAEAGIVAMLEQNADAAAAAGSGKAPTAPGVGGAVDVSV
ncbi:hypothetical protein [Stappia sp.]|uniref:hypothetical protein n=1 Tax=Stappia sp. TaxID=1870903 RepID=UPI0032D91AE5